MSAADVTPERFAELRLLEKHLCASGQMVGACLRESLAALESAWAERDAYLDEVRMTNENEARIMADLLATREERDQLRAELDRLRSAPVAVEVPEPSVQQWIYEVLKPAEADPEPHATLRHATRWFREHIRSIPSDRVLKEGEREELETWKRIAQDAEKERDEAQSAVARLLAWKRTILARMGALLDSATNARGAFSSDALRSGEAEERAHEPKHPPFPERPTPRVEEEAFEIPLSAMTPGQVIQSLHPRFWV